MSNDENSSSLRYELVPGSSEVIEFLISDDDLLCKFLAAKKSDIDQKKSGIDQKNQNTIVIPFEELTEDVMNILYDSIDTMKSTHPDNPYTEQYKILHTWYERNNYSFGLYNNMDIELEKFKSIVNTTSSSCWFIAAMNLIKLLSPYFKTQELQLKSIDTIECEIQRFLGSEKSDSILKMINENKVETEYTNKSAQDMYRESVHILWKFIHELLVDDNIYETEIVLDKIKTKELSHAAIIYCGKIIDTNLNLNLLEDSSPLFDQKDFFQQLYSRDIIVPLFTDSFCSINVTEQTTDYENIDKQELKNQLKQLVTAQIQIQTQIAIDLNLDLLIDNVINDTIETPIVFDNTKGEYLDLGYLNEENIVNHHSEYTEDHSLGFKLMSSLSDKLNEKLHLAHPNRINLVSENLNTEKRTKKSTRFLERKSTFIPTNILSETLNENIDEEWLKKKSLIHIYCNETSRYEAYRLISFCLKSGQGGFHYMNVFLESETRGYKFDNLDRSKMSEFDMKTPLDHQNNLLCESLVYIHTDMLRPMLKP